jgi:4-hydroxy-3-polyprenylbenzoate decarboxylase
MFDVMWAMSTRCDPPEDIQFIKRSWSTPLDPLLFEPPWQNNRAVVDACRPWDKKDRFPKVAEASPELKAKVQAKWPHLYR